MTSARVGLLTGPIGVGKTTAAERVIGSARHLGLTCGGLLAPAVLNSHGKKVGIWGVDVCRDERRILARTDRDLGGPSTGPYSFDAAALDWALATVERAMRPPDPVPVPEHGGAPLQACDLVLVDEIGKLELWQGIGLAPILPRLAAGQARRVLVLVRDSLLRELQGRLGTAIEQIVFEMNELNRETLPQQVLERLYGGHRSGEYRFL